MNSSEIARTDCWLPTLTFVFLCSIAMFLAGGSAVAAVGRSDPPPSPLVKQGIELRKVLDGRLPATYNLKPNEASDQLTPLFNAYIREGMELAATETILIAAGFSVERRQVPRGSPPIIIGRYKGLIRRGFVSETKLIVHIDSKVIDDRARVSGIVVSLYVAMP